MIQLRKNQRGQIRLHGELSEPFPNVNDMKQGECPGTDPLQFAIDCSMMPKPATVDTGDEDGVYTRYRLDGNLFNQRRLQSHTKTRRGISGSLFPRSTLPLSPTWSKLCSESLIALWMPHGCLSSRLASGRLRFFITLSPRRIPTTPHHHCRC